MKTFIFSFLFIYLITCIEARRIIIIRHGEKINDDYIGLSDKGKARANCLYQIFNDNTEFGKPEIIYSNRRGNRSHRPYDTVKPLADYFNIKVNEFSKYEPKEFVEKTVNKLSTEVILISSAREWIPLLIEAFGYYINEDEVDDFDNVWVIENDDKNGNGKLFTKKQKLDKCIYSKLDLQSSISQTSIKQKITSHSNSSSKIKTTTPVTTSTVLSSTSVENHKYTKANKKNIPTTTKTNLLSSKKIKTKTSRKTSRKTKMATKIETRHITRDSIVTVTIRQLSTKYLIIPHKTSNKKPISKPTNESFSFYDMNKEKTSDSPYAYRCGPTFKKCLPGFCCSRYNYCGQSKEYCGLGCQPKYGLCF